MQLIYRGQDFHLQPTQLHLMAASTIQVRTLIYRGATYNCDVLVPTEPHCPRALNWRYRLPQPAVDTALVPAL